MKLSKIIIIKIACFVQFVVFLFKFIEFIKIFLLIDSIKQIILIRNKNNFV